MSPTESRAAGDHRPASGRWSPMLARVTALLVLIVYVAGISVNAWVERRLGLQGKDSLQNVVLLVGFGMFAVVGALLVARRPANPIGGIMSAASLVVGVSALETYAAYVMTTRGRPDALAVVGAWANSWYWLLFLALVFVYLPLLFPDGRLPSRRWLPVAVLPGIGVVAMVVLGALTETLKGQNVDYRIDNPIGVEGLAHVEELPVLFVFSGLFAVGAVGAVASLVVRFRRSRGTERQQLKWFLYAAAPIPLLPVSDYMPLVVDTVAFGWVLVGIPAAVGIAVLRYRLYDIDLVINRTLVYVTLTALLVAVYVGAVVLLQGVFRALIGQESALAVVASTLIIAALFNPVRRRVQSFIDRRFYRGKYDAAKTLETFSAKLREGMDLEPLNSELLSVVRETVQPTHVSLWLKPADDSGHHRLKSAGESTE